MLDFFSLHNHSACNSVYIPYTIRLQTSTVNMDLRWVAMMLLFRAIYSMQLRNQAMFFYGLDVIYPGNVLRAF